MQFGANVLTFLFVKHAMPSMCFVTCNGDDTHTSFGGRGGGGQRKSGLTEKAQALKDGFDGKKPLQKDFVETLTKEVETVTRDNKTYIIRSYPKGSKGYKIAGRIEFEGEKDLPIHINICSAVLLRMIMLLWKVLSGRQRFVRCSSQQ